MKFVEGYFILFKGWNKVWQTSFLLLPDPCWNSESKSLQTEVESVGINRGWSSTKLLSGGKLLHQLNFTGKNWFSTTAGDRATPQLHDNRCAALVGGNCIQKVLENWINYVALDLFLLWQICGHQSSSDLSEGSVCLDRLCLLTAVFWACIINMSLFAILSLWSHLDFTHFK